MFYLVNGDAPNCKNCTFPICTGQQSCTKKTKYADGKWLGQASDVIVVDTPGFGDTENDDNTLIDEMMAVLKDTLKGANAIVLLVNGQQQRFNASIQQMLREMQVSFPILQFMMRFHAPYCFIFVETKIN